MTAEQITTIATSVLQGGALSFVGYQIVKGLRERVAALEKNIEVQKGTLDAMDRQIRETQKITTLYKSLLNDLPNDLKQYKTIVTETKDSVIVDLQRLNEEKDGRLRQLEERLAQASTGQSSPDTVRRRLAIQHFLLLDANKDFREFLIRLYRDVSLAVASLERCEVFEALLADRGLTLVVVPEKESFQALMVSENVPGQPHIQFASFGFDGGFALRSDGVLMISTDRLRLYQDALRSLQQATQRA